MKYLVLAFALVATPAFAQQPFNPDSSAYAITQSALSLAAYSRNLEQRIAQQQQMIDKLQEQIKNAKVPVPLPPTPPIPPAPAKP